MNKAIIVSTEKDLFEAVGNALDEGFTFKDMEFVTAEEDLFEAVESALSEGFTFKDMVF